jgi:hypothetical protein
MVSIIRNTITSQAERQAALSEINPELYLERVAAIRWGKIKETAAMFAAIAMGAFAFLFWLAYEGWITPDMFK